MKAQQNVVAEIAVAIASVDRSDYDGTYEAIANVFDRFGIPKLNTSVSETCNRCGMQFIRVEEPPAE